MGREEKVREDEEDRRINRVWEKNAHNAIAGQKPRKQKIIPKPHV